MATTTSSSAAPAAQGLIDYGDLETWITVLQTCKQLPESDIKRLCEKVRGTRVAPLSRRIGARDSGGGEQCGSRCSVR